ncbi:Ataxin 2-like [Xenotaenia resolanae]|uniref:Ataxin 2-like n=1 Tax=Xenotaenia resolanae TaxID=208358 RepID=A0ABV0W2Q9_9TELE
MRMVHVLTSVVGAKCELKVKNGAVYEGVFKTYSPECDLVLDAAHRKSPERSIGPRKEDIVESLIFKASDVVVVTFKDVDLNFARKVSSDTGNNELFFSQIFFVYTMMHTFRSDYENIELHVTEYMLSLVCSAFFCF